MPDTWETETGSEEEPMTDEETTHEPITFDDDLVDDLPPAAGSLYAEAVGRLIELAEESGGGGWLGLTTGNRKANSVQTGLKSAAKSLGVSIKTRTREIDGEKKVFVALADTDEDADTEEE